jgi:sulfate/thiosulfate-binding protein
VKRLRTIIVAACTAGLFLYAAWPWLPFSRKHPPRTIVVYGFSILGETLTNDIFPAFQKSWLEATGETVELVSSFAGSGTITNQILMGVPADIAIVALEPDAERLARGGATSPGSWRGLPRDGILNRTPFVIFVRPGNPKAIHDFSDLAKPGVRVIHPDPLTSGGANWAILAEYGAGLRAPGGSPETAERLLLGLWRNVVAQASSARAARTQFDSGFGDALITYEQEALWDRSRGTLKAEIVYPASTIESEHVVVVIQRHPSPNRAPLIAAFTRFLWSETAQRIFVHDGFRSVEERLNLENPSFGTIRDAFRVEALGGWSRARGDVIEGIWKNRVLKEVGR